MTDTIYIDYDTVVAINAEHCGPGAGVRDENGIRAALGRAEQSFGGVDLKPTIAEKAAAILHGLSSTQYFHDGNKRTAWLTAKLFLALNGHYLRPLSDVEAEAFVLSIATRAFEQDGSWDRAVDRAADWYVQVRRKASDRRVEAFLATAHMYPRTTLGLDYSVVNVSEAFVAGMELPEFPMMVQIGFVCQIGGFAEDAGRNLELLLDINPLDTDVATLAQPTQEVDGAAAGAFWSWHEATIGISKAHDMPWHANGVLPTIYTHPLQVFVQRPGLARIRFAIDGDLVREFPFSFETQ